MLVGKRITCLYVHIGSGRRPKTLKENISYGSLNKTFSSLYYTNNIYYIYYYVLRTFIIFVFEDVIDIYRQNNVCMYKL